jgi:hypothetical protein
LAGGNGQVGRANGTDVHRVRQQGGASVGIAHELGALDVDVHLLELFFHQVQRAHMAHLHITDGDGLARGHGRGHGADGQGRLDQPNQTHQGRSQGTCRKHEKLLARLMKKSSAQTQCCVTRRQTVVCLRAAHLSGASRNTPQNWSSPGRAKAADRRAALRSIVYK